MLSSAKTILLLLFTAFSTQSVILGDQMIKNPAEMLVSMVDGFLVSRGLYVVAELNIAEALLDGPATATVLAEKLDLNADALHRLLRMLAGHGVFTYNNDGSFELNDISRLMTKSHPQTLHGFLLHEDPARWQAYGNMAYSLKTGKPTFNHLFGKNYFEYIAQDKKRSEQFDQGMATFSEEENKQIAQAVGFTSSGHIIDIGGGVGGLLKEIVQHNANLHATLYELPHLESMARQYLQKHFLNNQISVTIGSFFDSIVHGGDVYILKRILHDWSDQECIQILTNCRNAMHNSAKLLVFDCIVPEDTSYDISKDIDIIMMVVFGGKERTKKEFAALFDAAGLKLSKATPVKGTMLSVLEVVKN